MAAVFESTFIQDLKSKLVVNYCPGTVFTKDNLSNKIRVRLFVGSMAYSGGGSVSATVIRPDGATVPITNGTLVSNIAEITLTEACFDFPGQIQVYMRVTSGDVKTIIFAGIFTVMQTETDSVIDPSGDIALDVADLVAQINEAIGEIPADYSQLQSDVESVEADITQINNTLRAETTIDYTVSATGSPWIEIPVPSESGYLINIQVTGTAQFVGAYNVSFNYADGGDMIGASIPTERSSLAISYTPQYDVVSMLLQLPFTSTGETHIKVSHVPNGNVLYHSGLTANAKTLLLTILRNGTYTVDQTANIDALENELT